MRLSLSTYSLTTVLALIGICMSTGTASAQPVRSSFFPDVFGETRTDDLPAMKERKVVRALVTPSMTDFFIHRGQPKGLQAELLQLYEKQLNQGISRRELKVRIVYVPVPFSDLIPSLIEGKGDIAAALMTITPDRQSQVDFVTGGRWRVNEVLVTSKSVSGINQPADLSGREVYVLRGSSYAEHLLELNRRLLSAGIPPVIITEAPAPMRTEDIIELVNAGVVSITVADDFKADLWAKIFPDVVVHRDIMINQGGRVGWAVRSNNPKLRKSLEKLMPSVRRGSLLGNLLADRYLTTTRWIRNPLDDVERVKLDGFMLLFKEYGDEYGFDWLAVLAQAFQESGLDHNARSRAGAVGIMQVLPSTGRYVGIEDVTPLENNIHAGVKYVTYLRDKYFSDPAIQEVDRLAFTWAAYNAGPSRIKKIRRHAAEMDLDPNVWFQNVEYAALRMVGQETVTYVANIYKYYIAYTLSRDFMYARADHLESIESQ